MGLGKSPQALWWSQRYLKSGPIIVVCPAYLKWNWQREAAKHTNLHAEILETTKPPKVASGMLSKDTVYVINYEILWHWLKFLKKLRPKLIIVDEGQYITNPRAKRSRAVKSLCEKSKHVLILTGTPFENYPVEMFTALNILCPKEFPSFHSFAHKFCGPRLKPWGWEFKGATNVPKLYRLLRKTCMIRRLKRDVLKDLPPKTRNVIPVKLYGDAQREYDAAEKDFIAWLQKTHPNKASRARKAERLVKVGYLKRLIGRLKLPAIKQWTDTFLMETKEKLITFGVQRDSVVEHLREHYSHTAVAVHGKIKGLKRQQSFDQFNSDKRVRLFYGNIRAAGTGWNCTSASKVAFAELAWTPGAHVQAEDRIYGLFRGVKGVAAMAYYFLGIGTIDEDVFRLIWEKHRVSNAVLDGDSLDAQNAVLDALEEILLRKGLKQKGKRS